MAKLLKKNKQNFTLGKLSLKHQVQFFSILGDLIQNGFSIQEALKFIESLKFADLKTINNRLQSGSSIAKALNDMISQDLYYQILIAEDHGNLTKTLIEIKNLVNFRYQQRSAVRQVLAYPFFLIIFLILIIISSRIFIMPQLSQLQGQNEAKTVNWFLMGGILFLFLITICLVIIRFNQLSTIKKARTLIKLPLIGKVFQYYYSYYITSNLSLLVRSGLDTKAICRLTDHFNVRTLFNQLGNEIKAKLQSGQDLVTIIYAEPLLSDEIAIFLSKGDVQLKLSQNLKAFAQMNFDKMNQSSRKLISLIQPIIFLLIGGGILLTYMSMLFPMYNSLQGGGY